MNRDCKIKNIVKSASGVRNLLADDWVKIFSGEISESDLECSGCEHEAIRLGHCNQCKVVDRSLQEKTENCQNCGEFPCDELDYIATKVPQAKEILDKLQHNY